MHRFSPHTHDLANSLRNHHRSEESDDAVVCIIDSLISHTHCTVLSITACVCTLKRLEREGERERVHNITETAWQITETWQATKDINRFGLRSTSLQILLAVLVCGRMDKDGLPVLRVDVIRLVDSMSRRWWIRIRGEAINEKHRCLSRDCEDFKPTGTYSRYRPWSFSPNSVVEASFEEHYRFDVIV